MQYLHFCVMHGFSDVRCGNDAGVLIEVTSQPTATRSLKTSNLVYRSTPCISHSSSSKRQPPPSEPTNHPTMSACTVEKAPQGPPGQPQIRLELPGEIKSLEDLHLKAPLPRRPKQQYQHNYHHRRRGSSHDAAAIRSKASPDFESDHRRRPSLSAAEAFFLRSLLIDDAQVSPNAAAGQSDLNQKKELSDSILFSIPPSLNEHQPACCEAKSKVPPKPKRPSNKGLWQAHAAGIPPRQLVRQQALTRKLSSSLPGRNGENSPHGTPHLSRAQSGPEFPAVSSLDDNVPLVPDGTPFGGATAQSEGPNNLVSPAVGSSRRHHRLYGRAASDTSATLEALAQSSSIDYDDFCPSDQEVRPRKDKEDDDSSDDSSWGNDNHLKQFNAWEILEDEYAGDFGFETHTSPGSFMILGTSAVDTAAHPHVMSPPLMDALMHHLPPNIRGDNYWLRFCKFDSIRMPGSRCKTFVWCQISHIIPI